jgi:hypothetical protein
MSVIYIYGFHTIFFVHRKYFLKEHQLSDLSNGEVLCCLGGTERILKYCLDELRLERPEDV